MDRERVRIGLSRVAIFAAVVVCAQVGYVRYTESERSASLEARLQAQRRENQRAIARLSQQREVARAREQELHASLARSSERSVSLEQELRFLTESARVLRDELTTLSQTLREEPPFLDVRLAPTESLDGLRVVAENRGEHPVEIADSRGLLWLGTQAGEIAAGAQIVTLEPGGETDFFEYRLVGNEPRLVATGAVPLRGALCFVYQRVIEAGASPFVREVWFEYQPALRAVAVLRREAWQLSAGEVPCELAAAERPW